MAIVYLEELVKHVPNKYLAVNVIAKRARSLNDELLGAGLSKKQKPVSIATDELSSGELSYKIVNPETSESEVKSLFSSESEGYNTLEGEDHLEELYGEKTPDKDVVASEEDTEKSEDESEEAS
ncbi:DNA-directed RNA polymerase subunit omega [Candidatus Poribacteria bacterium]|nr:DNA-directed RNA polymerase subunit omega [Candidatus Poribacteria bacterium]